MLRTLQVLPGRRSAYRRLYQYRAACLYKIVIRDLHVYTAAQYCVSVKDKDFSQVKNFDYNNVEAKPLHTNITLKELTEKSLNEFEEKYGKSQRLNKEIILQKRMERLYSDPKSSLLSIYSIVGHDLKNQQVLTSSIKAITINKSNLWEVTVNVKWPEVKSFKEIGKTKTLAFKNAAWKCLQWLEINSKLKNGKPCIYNEEEIKNIQFKSVELNVAPQILNNMTELIKTYNTEIQSMVLKGTKSHNLLHRTLIHHPILEDNGYSDILLRNKTLKDRLLNRSNDDAATLPIHEFKDEILSQLENHRVLLIEGDTGCGKTTQVPQFILDAFTKNNNASACNILVSQPRRISAISLADRIAYERKEHVGDVVGFHVRLEQLLPKELGAIVFCTTGMLLRKLQFNPTLKGCSHIILDEAHERQIDTDMLMILLKRALQKNPDLKVLIMSATINTHIFQQYFDCPTVRVPGRLFPVKMHFLNDIEHLPNIKRYKTYVARHRYEDNDADKLSVDFGKIVQVIKWISSHKPPGAILCFLPGWHEITKVQSLLEDTSFYNQNHLILPMHSKVSHNEQRKIFQHTPNNVRKIILATDIAETGITVSDVVYVVDSALRKESHWDDAKDLPNIRNYWVSRANIQQRKGRAGRVQPGESYHLISKEEYEKLQAHPIPQLLCNPLEKVILDSKTYADEKAQDFLGGFLEPPTSTAIQKAVRTLVNLGVMDDEENLTALGKRMALFPTHPKFSKAIIYSSIFDCIQPVVTIASIFSGDDSLFYNILDQKLQIRENKKIYHPSSDHIAMAWIFKQWVNFNEEGPHLIRKFCKDMMIRPLRIQILSQIRNTFIQHLIQCRMLSKTLLNDYDCNKSNVANKFENNDELVRAILYSATQQLIEHKDAGFKNGILRRGINELRIQSAKAIISGESVNYKRKVWPSSFLTYFNAAHCDVRRSIVVRETSLVSPLTVLLFNQKEVQYHELDDNRAKIVINVNARQTIRFICNKETANVLLQFRNVIWSLVQYFLETQGFVDHKDLNSKQILEYKEKVFKTLAESLKMSSEFIEKIEKNSLG